MNEGRSHIDPEGKYPSDGMRKVEQNAGRVLDLLPSAVVERTRDCIQIDYGGEEGIVVLITAEAIELRLPTVEWTMGSYVVRLITSLTSKGSTHRLHPKCNLGSTHRLHLPSITAPRTPSHPHQSRTHESGQASPLLRSSPDSRPSIVHALCRW